MLHTSALRAVAAVVVPAAAGGGGRRPFPVGAATADPSGSETLPYFSVAAVGSGAFAWMDGGSEGSMSVGGGFRGHLPFLRAAVDVLSGEAQQTSACRSWQGSTLTRTAVYAVGGSHCWELGQQNTRAAGKWSVLLPIPCTSSSWGMHGGTA